MRYAIISNGKVANIIQATAWPDGIDITGMEPMPGIGWDYDGTTFTAPEPDELPEPPALPRHITEFALWQRFTPDERVDYDLASIHNPSADETAQRNAARLRDLKELVRGSRYVDLDLPLTIAGIQGVEAMGVIAEGRAAAILDGEVLDDERA